MSGTRQGVSRRFELSTCHAPGSRYTAPSQMFAPSSPARVLANGYRRTTDHPPLQQSMCSGVAGRPVRRSLGGGGSTHRFSRNFAVIFPENYVRAMQWNDEMTKLEYRFRAQHSHASPFRLFAVSKPFPLRFSTISQLGKGAWLQRSFMLSTP